MGRRFVARQGTWRLGSLIITQKGIEIGKGAPPGGKTWEWVENAITSHNDFGNIIIEVPNVAQEIAAEAEKAKTVIPQAWNGITFRCPYCGEEFTEMDLLEQHKDNCPALLAEKERLRKQILVELGVVTENVPDTVPAAVVEVKPLGVPNLDKEAESAAEQERIKKEQEDAEAQAKAEKKAKNEKIYGNRKKSPEKTTANPTTRKKKTEDEK